MLIKFLSALFVFSYPNVMGKIGTDKILFVSCSKLY